ncbi:MAG TPA: TetR/AcrR family transcriptional regulator [Planctomycetota bacterium]|nr:TetR/AcrR family transcriptional regulator [Planctomycetota bacterium]
MATRRSEPAAAPRQPASPLPRRAGSRAGAAPSAADPAPAGAVRKPGRPRDAECCLAIRDAALTLLVERGFADVTIESIAARAGVGKATVYRRWPSKADLVVHAFFETIEPRIHIPDSGDLRADFRRQLRLVVREMAGPNGRVLATLLGCMQTDPGLAESFRTRWLAVRRAEGRLALERGVQRGTLPPDTDPGLVLDALYSPLHFRLLAGHAPLSTDFSDRLVDLVFDGLGVRRPPAGRRPARRIRER